MAIIGESKMSVWHISTPSPTKGRRFSATPLLAYYYIPPSLEHPQQAHAGAQTLTFEFGGNR